MKNKEIQERIEKVKDYIPEAYVYDAKNRDVDKMIIQGKKGGRDYTISFRLDMDDPTKFDYKFLSFMSFLTATNHYGARTEVNKYAKDRIERYFKKQFTIEELQDIYCRIGTGCNPELGWKFIESGLDMEILK